MVTTNESQAPVVEAAGLVKVFSDFWMRAKARAVDGIDFSIRRHEIFGLLGANGAGKTTTLECMLGLREPDSGTIEVCGFDARKDPREVKQRVGAALQSTALQDKLTPREALALFGTLYRQSVPPQELITRFGLQEQRILEM